MDTSTQHRFRTTTLGVTALLVAATLAGCSGGADDSDGSVDARTYVEQYETDAGDAAQSGAVVAETGEPVPQAPRITEHNQFVGTDESIFTGTETDPLSTFGLDVDTGSWGVGQLLLGEGVVPPRDSIRPEEWVNAMPADLPAPDDELGVSVDSSAAPYAEDGTALVRVGVQAREVTAEDRSPVHLTFVVDTSGSMDIRNRLGLVQSTLALLVDSLEPTDTVAVVTYSTGSSVLLEPTPVSEGDAIVAAIGELRPHGSTNLADGLADGYALAGQTYDPAADNVVVLASDGVANVGVTGPGSLADMVQERAAQDIHLATVGYGMGNYNDFLMEQLADQGDGFYSYVDTFEEAQRLFVDDLPELLTVVAEDAKVQVAFDPTTVDEYRLVGYANRALNDGAIEDPTADAGEIGAGASVTALYELRLAPGVEPGTSVGEVDLRWRSGDDDSQRGVVAPVAAPDPSVPAEGSAAVAALTGTLAELLRHDSVVAARGVTLADLSTDVAPLVEAGVPGAAELAETIALATAAQPQDEPAPLD